MPAVEPVKPVAYGATPDSVIVACVWVGDKYPIEYVRKLHSMVKRNLSMPFRFACLSDNEVNIPGVERYHPRHDWPGWWQKVALFDPDLFPRGRRVLYLDLDVVVCRSIDNLCCVADPLALVENFSPNRARSPHNSSVMVWDAGGIATRIYERFHPQVMSDLHGDQCWIWRAMDGYTIPNFPRSDIQSYKYDSLRGRTDPQVVIFHGKPDPHEVNHELVREHWK